MPASSIPPALPRPLILASTSRYRQALLARLRMPFSVEAPGVDETPDAAEPAAALARRLALQKARAVAQRHPQAWVIGSDQVAELLPASPDGPSRLLGKPGDRAAARRQLRAMSGRALRFHTAVAVVVHASGFEAVDVSEVQLQMRPLEPAWIERYLDLDEPYDCAGSAKVEALGIALADRIDSTDPTALEGLPLILTCRLLREAGLEPLAWAR